MLGAAATVPQPTRTRRSTRLTGPCRSCLRASFAPNRRAGPAVRIPPPAANLPQTRLPRSWPESVLAARVEFAASSQSLYVRLEKSGALARSRSPIASFTGRWPMSASLIRVMASAVTVAIVPAVRALPDTRRSRHVDANHDPRSQVCNRLADGGRWIRTLGPPARVELGSAELAARDATDATPERRSFASTSSASDFRLPGAPFTGSETRSPPPNTVRSGRVKDV
jgi:hypothetical protein